MCVFQEAVEDPDGGFAEGFVPHGDGECLSLSGTPPIACYDRYVEAGAKALDC